MIQPTADPAPRRQVSKATKKSAILPTRLDLVAAWRVASRTHSDSARWTKYWATTRVASAIAFAAKGPKHECAPGNKWICAHTKLSLTAVKDATVPLVKAGLLYIGERSGGSNNPLRLKLHGARVREISPHNRAFIEAAAALPLPTTQNWIMCVVSANADKQGRWVTSIPELLDRTALEAQRLRTVIKTMESDTRLGIHHRHRRGIETHDTLELQLPDFTTGFLSADYKMDPRIDWRVTGAQNPVDKLRETCNRLGRKFEKTHAQFAECAGISTSQVPTNRSKLIREGLHWTTPSNSKQPTAYTWKPRKQLWKKAIPKAKQLRAPGRPRSISHEQKKQDRIAAATLKPRAWLEVRDSIGIPLTPTVEKFGSWVKAYDSRDKNIRHYLTVQKAKATRGGRNTTKTPKARK
jgi:hypothetical protein